MTFTKAGGTSTFVEAFALGAMDNGDGTYTAQVTGDMAGTAATIGATIGVTPVTSTVSLGVSAGTISETTSTVSIVGGATTVASGSNVTVKLQAKDAAGNNLSAGGATVTFTKTGGTSTFSQSFPVTATDNGDGTYSATLTGLAAGTAATIGAKIGSNTVTSSTTLAVSSGAISAAQSVVSIVGGASSVASGSSVTVKLQAKDAAGNNLSTGGSSVTFTQTGGTATFTQAFPVTATDNGDGTYTAQVTGNAVGTAKTIGAKIGATAVTSTTSLSVTPGTIAAATSTVSIVGGATTVASGSSVTVKLQGKDAAGNNVTTGGATVAFVISGGSSTFTQSFPLSASDATDGTYTATLTGLASGAAQTIKATIGAATTTSSTTLSVVPGAISTATSSVFLVGNPTTVASGSSVTIRMQAKDAASNTITSGGALVTFTKTGGTSTFTQSFAVSATDGGNGTYSATLTGASAGTATTLGATIGGTPISATTDLQVTPGAISTATSIVSASASTVSSGSTVQLKLDARDAQNNVITTGGSTVTFTQTGGTSTFAESFPVAATDNGDGTYTVNVTGATAGTAKTIGAKIGASAVTSTTSVSVNSSVGANIANQPTGTNNVTALNVTVSGTGVAYYKYKVGVTASTDCSNATGYGSETAVATHITADISGVGDGSVTLCVIGADATHNYQDVAAATTASWTKKATRPSFTSLDLINEAADGYVNSADHALANPIAGNLVASAYTTATYKLVIAATTCDGSLTYGAMPNENNGTDFGADGNYKVCVKLVDTAGNAPAYGATNNFALKTAAISFSSLSLANDAVGGYINLAESSTSNALVGSASGSNFDTAAYKLVASGTTCNGSLTYGSIPASNSSDFGADGTYKVCAKLSDNAGNTPAYGASSNITLKKAVPTFTSIALAGDATDGYINNTEKTAANALAGSLSATNYDTAGYKLTTSATTCDNALTYGSMPASNSADFSNADGTYKVCVKLTDNAGNPAAYGNSSNIVRKTTLPTFTSLGAGTDNADGYINAAENLLTNPLASSLSASNYDTAQYKLAASATACSGLTYGAMPTDNSSDFGADGNYKVCVKLTDAAGNTPAYGNNTAFALKTASPSFSALALANDAANGYINAAERALMAALGSAATGSGFDTAAYALVDASATCNGSLTYGSMPADNSGDFGADGNYKICAKLTDNAGNPASYGSSSTMVLDTAAPSVSMSSATSNPTNANPIAVTVTFSESVTGFVSGDVTPSGATLSGFSGSGASYSFNLAPSGASVTANIGSAAATDAAGNKSTAASQFSRTYDGTAPTISSVTSSDANGTYGIGSTVSVQITFSENVTVTGTPLLTLNTTPSARTASYASGSGTTVLTFTYAPQSGDTSADLDYSSTSALATNGGSIKDAAGNNATLTLPTVGGASSLGGQKNLIIDTSAATVILVSSDLTGAQKATTVIPIKIQFDDVITVNTGGGTPSLALNTSPARSATYASGSGTDTLVFNYTVQAGDIAGLLDYAATSSLVLNGGTLKDSSNAHAVLSLPTVGGASSLSSSNLTVDTTAPTVTNVSSTTDDSTYSVGAQIDVTVSFSEPVYATGSPRIQLNVTNSGSTVRYATYSSGSGTGTLTFSYVVQGPNSASGDMAPSLDYASTSALGLNGGTLNDAAGNAATLTLASPGAAGSLAANTNLVIEASQPPALSISGTTSTTASGAISMIVQYPADVSAYATVKVYRVLGATAPAADCATGTLVKTYSSGFSPGLQNSFTDSTGNPGKIYSYRVCAMTAGNAIDDTATATSLTASAFQWVFVTKAAVASGNLGGVSGANATCQTAGNSIDSTLTWLAVLSDTSREAKGRIPIIGTVYNRNATPGTVTTTASNGFFASTAARQYAEDGTAQTLNAWTGTTNTGLRQATTNMCSDWGSTSGNGYYGVVTSTSTTWFASAAAACTTSTNRLYCVSKAMEPLVSFSTSTPSSGTAGDVTVVIDFPDDTTNWTKAEIRRLKPTWNATTLQWNSPSCTTGTVAKTWNGPTFTDETFTDSTNTPGAYYMYTVCVYSGTNVAASYTTINKPTRAWGGGSTSTIFLTSVTQAGNFGSYNGGSGGLAAVDAFCQARGDTFSTGKTWKAILSTSTVSAASRISSSGTIRNLIGTTIGNNYADLFDSSLAAAISYVDTFATSTSSQIWTGSTTAGLVDGTNTCSDWSLNSGGAGRRGTANSTTGTWINNGTTSTCNSLRRIWCIQSTPD